MVLSKLFLREIKLEPKFENRSWELKLKIQRIKFTKWKNTNKIPNKRKEKNENYKMKIQKMKTQNENYKMKITKWKLEIMILTSF